MKKYFLSFFLIIAFVFYVMLENQSSVSVSSNSPDGAAQAVGAGTVAGTDTSAANMSTTSVPTPPVAAIPPTVPPVIPTPAPTPTPASTGLYRDGSYDGDSVDAYFGNVQVEAIISGGKLANVKVLAYPADRGTSVRINNRALPQLVQEAISSQSANVDIVSGATQTSQGFRQSLASALTKAKN